MINVVRASEFVNLKNRIKNEVKRRKYTGSVESYGGAEYDYTVTPRENIAVNTEHINKIVTPLKAVNPDGIYEEKSNGGVIEKIEVLDTRVTLLESKPLLGSDTGCKTSCTGLCSSACSGTCTSGCSGSCSGCTGCGSACSNGCTGCGGCSGCGGACSSSCSGCSGTCKGTCDTSCTHTCAYNCSATCGQGCGGSCAGAQC